MPSCLKQASATCFCSSVRFGGPSCDGAGKVTPCPFAQSNTASICSLEGWSEANTLPANSVLKSNTLTKGSFFMGFFSILFLIINVVLDGHSMTMNIRAYSSKHSAISESLNFYNGFGSIIASILVSIQSQLISGGGL